MVGIRDALTYKCGRSLDGTVQWGSRHRENIYDAAVPGLTEGLLKLDLFRQGVRPQEDFMKDGGLKVRKP